MKRIRKFLPILLLALLVLSDYVAFQEIRHSLAWIVGDNATPAAIAMLFLANAVTTAFFFEGLTAKSVRILHGIALLLYTVVMFAIYASGVESGMKLFPTDVAQEAFGISQLTAVRIASLVIGFSLAFASFAFWHVIGSLINQHTNASNTVAWRAKAQNAGMPVDNILGINHPTRNTGS